MLPYIFSSFTIKSVGKAAFGMVEEVRRQIRENPGILDGTVEPDYRACIAISTKASLTEMIVPGLLVQFISYLGRFDSFVHWICIWTYYVGWIPSRLHSKWGSTSYFCSQYWWSMG